MNQIFKVHPDESIYLDINGALVRLSILSPSTGSVSLRIAAPPEVRVIAGDAAERLDAQPWFREGKR